MVAYHLFKEVLLTPTFLYENDKIVGFCPTFLKYFGQIVGRGIISEAWGIVALTKNYR